MESQKDYYLRRAAQARALARAASPLFRDDLLHVAEQWDMLARETEAGRAEQAVPPVAGRAA